MLIRRTRKPIVVEAAPIVALGQQVFHPVYGSGQLDCVINMGTWKLGIVKVAMPNGFREYRRAPMKEWRVLVRQFTRRTRAAAK